MSTSASVHTIVAEGVTRTFPRGVTRDNEIVRLANRVSVIKGIRRCGKTYRMFQRINELLDAGTPRNRILFVDFEDDRLEPADSETIAQVIEEFLRLVPPAADEPTYLFFDEIQAVPGWGRTLRRLSQDGRFELCLSGSSAKMLSSDIESEFRGRAFSTECWPYSFREFLRARDEEPPAGTLSPDEERFIATEFENYLLIGGFPEVQGCDAPTRIVALQEVVGAIVARDLAERHNLPLLGARKFAQYALRLSGREFSTNKIYHTLHSMRVPLSKEAAFALPAHCEDAYLFFLAPRFGADFVEAATGRRKLYAIDPGLLAAMGATAQGDEGQRLETAVYIELRRRLRGTTLSNIGFYRTPVGFEVDFAIGDADSARPDALCQVSYDLEDPSTLARETRALSEALDATGLQSGALIACRNLPAAGATDPRIRIVPAWRWMLE